MTIDRLLVLPGLDGTGTLFEDFLSALPSTLTVEIARYPTQRFLSYSELVPYVEEMVTRSGLFVVVAESFSTPLAAMLAATSPPNLAGLVICAGFITNPTGSWSLLVRGLARPSLFRLVPPPTWALEHFLIGTSPLGALEARVREALRLVNPKVLAWRVRAILDCDARKDLSQTQIPMMYIQAEDDHLVRAECFIEIQRLRPNTILASIPGPHLVLQCEPQKAAEVLMQFLQQLPH